jgi:hypothetical protein
MPHTPLPFPYDPRPLDSATFRLNYRWESDSYSVRLACLVHGSDTWLVDTYDDLTLDEALDVVVASLRS